MADGPERPGKNHIVSWRKIREFLQDHPEDPSAVAAFGDWYRRVEKAPLRRFADVRNIFPAADQVGHLVVFNVGGNKYRLIAELNYRSGTIFIRHVLTHGDYDQGGWRV